jgi:hypothetical protein
MIYLAAGMFVFWLVTFLFVITVLRRQRKLEEDVAALREALQDSMEDPARR